MVVIGQSGFIRANVVVFGQKWLCLGKCCCIRARRLSLGKVVVFVQGGYIRASWLYSRKSGCNKAKVVVFGQKRLYSGKSGCNRTKVVVSGQNGYIRSETVLFGQSGCVRSIVVVVVQIGCMQARWFYSGKSGCLREKVVVFW